MFGAKCRFYIQCDSNSRENHPKQVSKAYVKYNNRGFEVTGGSTSDDFGHGVNITNFGQPGISKPLFLYFYRMFSIFNYFKLL